MSGESVDKPRNSSVSKKKTPVEPPPLSSFLLDPRPVIAVCVVAWVVAAVAAFAIRGLDSWRPVTIAGLGLAVFGTSVFLWQRHAARSGSRGAQSGLG